MNISTNSIASMSSSGSIKSPGRRKAQMIYDKYGWIVRWCIVYPYIASDFIVRLFPIIAVFSLIGIFVS